MDNFRNYQNQMTNSGAKVGVVIDEGLRAYMLKVYNLMAFGLAVTGVVSFLTNLIATTRDPSLASATLRGGVMLTDVGVALYTSPLHWLVMLAPVFFVFFINIRINYLSAYAAKVIFAIYAGLMGLSMSSIFLVYTGQSIVQTFFVTSAAFASLSLFGYTTKKDLTAVGSFMIMGLFGIFIASLVNIFLRAPALQFAISAIGLIIFAGLTAYDTQKVKEMYFGNDRDDVIDRKAVIGALTLYLDFINLFIFLLQFLGNRRD
ncbi:putative membrane protein [Liberibacter crescens BT-1]|uniref:Putative membrane protein n=1 Tax=Liberibacter crescens (strain BT-1) TaxID=1215343 RepID=L0EUQ8_LIBCB|nr:Bax inhibitor-1/YccA family protein [Liberibacter crescens]AGA64111.1 putative membrane protein [Liberibacter crescens BT-1]AMC12392.1 membrane protein [Liberibacter crescens]